MIFKFKKYKDFINEITFNSQNINNLLTEGGGYGRLNHPFDDLDLTFNDLKELIIMTCDGLFSEDNFVREKTDGQNIMISWKNGNLISARNKGHLKNKGETAPNLSGFKEFFGNRPKHIYDTFVSALVDLETAFSKLSEKEKLKYFNEGEKFLSLEIMTPVTQNTVYYDKNMLVFHSIITHDEDGNVIDENNKASRELENLILKYETQNQTHFTLRGPNDIEIVPFKNSEQRKKYYIQKLNSIIKDSNVTMESYLRDYVFEKIIEILKLELDKNNIQYTEQDEQFFPSLLDRIAGINKTFSIRNIKNTFSEEFVNWYLDAEKKHAKYWRKNALFHVETLFLEIGTEMMTNMTKLLTLNPSSAAERMRKEIEQSIKTIKTNGDEDDVRKLEHELKRLSAVGGLDSLIPTEGITFQWKGKMYKYTGIFAVTHQIRSIIAYGNK